MLILNEVRDHQFEMHKMLGVVTHTFHPSTREAQSFN